MDVADKVIAVTGGGNGIGREVVLALLERGAHVAAIDLNEAALQETARLAGPRDTSLSLHPVDITDRTRVLALPAEVVERFDRVDGLVNVAGIIHRFAPVAELDFADLERVLAVNFWGTVNTTKAFLPLLSERPRAALVNVASMGSLVPFPGQSAYGASKAAVKLFTEGLIAEHRGSALQVTVVFPGAIATQITDNSGVVMDREGGVDMSAAAARMTSAPDAAGLIVAAIERGRPRVLIGKDAKLLDALSRIMPSRAIGIIADRMRDLVGG